MIDLLTFCLCVSLGCTAIHIAFTWPGMIFYWVGKTCEHWIWKPIITCLSCMGSYWTFVFFGMYSGLSFWFLPFAILITVGINTLICALLEKVSDYGC